MILEEATFEAFGYYPGDLKHQRNKLIIASCELCGGFRILSKRGYHTFCISCAHKGKQHTAQTKAKISAAKKGENHPNYGKPLSKSVKAKISISMKGEKHPNYGKQHTAQTKAKISAAHKANPLPKEMKLKMSAARKGRHPTEEAKAKMRKNHADFKGEKNPGWKGGTKAAHARSAAKRKRDLGYTLIAPIKEGEVGHHVTNEYVIGIPKRVHEKIRGSRKKHRTQALQWLKTNDKKKYNLVLCILAKQSLKQDK